MRTDPHSVLQMLEGAERNHQKMQREREAEIEALTPPELTVAGFGHIEKVGLRWQVPGIGRVTHEWLTEALGREPVDEEWVTTSVQIKPKN